MEPTPNGNTEIPPSPDQIYNQELNGKNLYRIGTPEAYAVLTQGKPYHDYIIGVPENSGTLVNQTPEVIMSSILTNHRLMCQNLENAYRTAYPFNEPPYIVALGRAINAVPKGSISLKMLPPKASTFARGDLDRGQKRYPEALDIEIVKQLTAKEWEKLKDSNPDLIILTSYMKL